MISDDDEAQKQTQSLDTKYGEKWQANFRECVDIDFDLHLLQHEYTMATNECKKKMLGNMMQKREKELKYEIIDFKINY